MVGKIDLEAEFKLETGTRAENSLK